MKLRLPTTPLFLQALGLVVAALVAADIATVVVVLNLPPPPPDVYRVADVVQAVHHHGPTQTPEGRDLTSHLAAQPPALETRGHRRLQFRAAVASALGVVPSAVVVAQPGPRIVALGASPGPRHTGPWMEEGAPMLLGGFEVGVRQGDGRWLVIAPMSAFGIDPWQQRLLLVLAIAAIA
ncbi:MAG TPA: hypothetical protein VIJ59_02805, partial [Caulobacteraceae bacterium]